ncbi:MAG: hypothetical protein PWP71_49 [Clostridia bacterium]|jgi:hypothetical protein|nr:hypothetical protein [Clostridia bacterium]
MSLTFLFRFLTIIGVTFLLVYVILRFTGSWKKTLNRVIKRYLEIKELHPNYSDKEVFFAVLDKRYPNTAVTKELFAEKEKIKEKITVEIKRNSDIFQKYNLPTLIFCCLVIEKNNILHKQNKDGIKKILRDITDEVKKQGLEGYI